MKKLFIVESLVVVFLVLTSTISAWGETRKVPSEYPTIQSAINQANNGDTVLVDPGQYAEQIDFISKQITVQGVQGAAVKRDGYEMLSQYGVNDPDDTWLSMTETSGGTETVTLKIQFNDGGVAEDMITVTFTAGAGATTNLTLQEVVDAINAQSQNLGNDPYGNSKNYSMASIYYNLSINKYYLKVKSRLSGADASTMTISTDTNTNVTGAFIIAKNQIDVDVTEDDMWADGQPLMEKEAGPGADTAVIDAVGGIGVLFDGGESPNSVLKNIIIKNAQTAISITDSSPTIANITIVENMDGIEVSGTSSPDISNCILWDNAGDDLVGAQVRYSCVEDGDPGEGNISDDPYFDGLYHLSSQAGRWQDYEWVIDEDDSPCIDAGDSDSPIGLEPFPNGGIVNMGAYGGTVLASKSYFGVPVCQAIVAGDINGDCKVDFKDFAILSGNWLEDVE